MTSRLSPERIAGFCQGRASQVAVEVVEETGSTNADLMARLATLRTPTLRLAETQTAGRGRAGRTWYSRPGSSLTFSLAWPFSRPVHALVGLPLAVGVALAEALGMFSVEARLKWPNDILHEGRKLAGVLIETAGMGESSWAVIGIGLNMGVSADMAAKIARPVASLPWLSELDQDMLLATLLNRLAAALDEFARTGFAGFTQRWNALHAYAGQAVVILDNGKLLHQGTAAGVDATGRFLLDTAAGRLAIIAGDISLRPVED
jgi:BirA family biotin operon repressor/biotin-[acetyl-CoA-carboxylase] ligase